jgi:hypothetical protein
MRYYIDCEFDGHNGPLLSMALVTDGEDSIHIRAKNFALDRWVIANVEPFLDSHEAPQSAYAPEYAFGGLIREFIGEDELPVIIADSPVDSGWASADYPAMRFEVHNVDCYPTVLEGAVQHNAWWDAMALRVKLGEVGE